MGIVSDLGVKVWASVDNFIGGMERVKRQFNDVKRTLGKGSVIGQIGDVLVGGGAIAGVTVIVSHLTRSLASMNNVLHEAAIQGSSFDDVLGEILRKAPVLGSFVGLWDEVISLSGRVLFGKSRDDIIAFAKQLEATDTRIEHLQGTLSGERSRAGADTFAIRRLDAQKTLDVHLKEIDALRDIATEKRQLIELDLARANALQSYQLKLADVAEDERKSIKNNESLTRKTIKGLEAELNALLLSKGAFAAYQAGLDGALPHEQKFIEAMRNHIDTIKEQSDAVKEHESSLQSFSKGLFERTRTNVEQATVDLERMQEAFKGGFIDQETLNRGVKEIRDRFARPQAEPRATTFGQAIEKRFFDLAGLSSARTGEGKKVVDDQLVLTNKFLASIDRKIATRSTGAILN